jgi:hypothetical protein
MVWYHRIDYLDECEEEQKEKAEKTAWWPRLLLFFI